MLISRQIEAKKCCALREGTAYLIATRQAERALSAGCRAPTFRLADQSGTAISSENLLKRSPLVLMFYSGTWCPSCTLDLVSIDQLRPLIKSRGAEVIAISQQTAAENRQARNLNGIEMPILEDPGGKVSFQFGVRWAIPEFLRDLHRAGGVDLPKSHGDNSWTLPIPARFVIDQNGIIVYSEINPDQTRHTDPRGILPVLDFLHRR
jgi:peroxiredoxin